MPTEKIILEFELPNAEQSQKSIDEFTLSIDRLQKEMKENKKTRKDFSVQNARLKDEIKKLNTSRREEIKILTVQKGSLDELKLRTQRLTKAKNALGDMNGKNKKRFNALTKEIKKHNEVIKKAEARSGSFGRNVGNYPKFLSGATAKMFGLVGGVTALVSVFGRALKTITGFESAIDKLQAITKASDEEIKLLKDDAIRLGSTTSKTAIEVANLQTEFAKLGFTTQQIRDATEATIQLSIAAGSDLAESATIAGATIKGFGLDTNETQRVVDVMAESFATSALDIGKFSVAMANVQVAAKATIKELEQTTALLGAIVDTGTDASKAGTDLRAIFSRLAKQSLSLEDAYEKVNNSSNKVVTAMGLVGDRAFSSLITLAENKEKTDELTESYKNAAGSAKEMADVMEDNVQGDIKKASSAWEGFILSIDSGEGTISTALRIIIQGFTEFIGLLNLINKTGAEIQRSEYLKTLSDQAKEDVKEFEIFQKSLEESTGKQLELKDAVDRFLESDKKKLALLKEGQKLKFPGASEEELKLLGAFLDTNETLIQSLEKRIEAITKLTEISPRQIEIEKQAAEELTKAQKKEAEKRRKQAQKDYEEQVELNEELRKLEFAEKIETQEELDQMDEDAFENHLKNIKDNNEKKLEEERKLREDLTEIASQATNTIFNFLQGSLDNEETRIKQSYDKRQSDLEKQLSKGLITQEQFDKKSEKLEKQKALAIYKIELARFNNNKIQALANITIDIASAVAKIWGQTGITAIALQALPIAAGVLQAAVVAGAPPPQRPSFAEGGSVLEGKKHSEGGIKFYGDNGTNFEAEAGEGIFITKREATKNLLSRINEKYGGRSFRSSASYMQEGGRVETESTIDNHALINAISRIVNIVRVEDIQTGIDDRDKIRAVRVIS